MRRLLWSDARLPRLVHWLVAKTLASGAARATLHFPNAAPRKNMPAEMKKCAVWLAACWAWLPAIALAADWERHGTEDGVLLESRQVPDSSLPEFRGSTTLAATILEIAAIIDDLGRFCEWQKRCVGARQLQRTSDTERIFYTRTEAPWPLQDRDTVLRGKVAGLGENQDIVVRFEHLHDPRFPPHPGVVRMPTLTGHFRMTRIDGDHTRVEYQVRADPGGMVPAWAARLSARQVPRDTLAGLRRHLPKVRGQYAAFIDKWRAPAAP